MRILKKLLVVAMLALVAGLGSTKVMAQNRPNRGNFDPEQFRQRMMDRYREELDVKDDGEWKLISERINKVMEARREVGFGGPGMFGRGRRGGNDNGNDQNRRPRFGPEPSAAAEALEKAIESNASADEIKSKLAKYRDEKKEKRAKLDKAQDELKQVLSVKQEAAAVMAGLID